MPRFISFDTEVYYDAEYSVTTMGNYRYTRDPRFNFYLLSVYDGQEAWAGSPQDFNWNSLESNHLLSHNAGFDMGTYDAACELGIAKRVPLAGWDCTADMSACLFQRRSLAAAVEHVFGIVADKGARADAKGKHWSDMVADGSAPRMLEYAKQDAILCWRLWNEKSHLWSDFERSVSRHMRLLTRRGFPVDTEKVSDDQATLNEALRACEKRMPWIESGYKPTSPIAIAGKCREVGIPTPPTKSHEGGEEAYAEWELEYSPKFDWIESVGQWRSIGKMISAVDELNGRIRPDGVLSYDWLYYGAHTGRPAGRGFNMLNLRKVPLYFDQNYRWLEPESDGHAPAGTAHSVDQRGWFVPFSGDQLAIVDSSQIEPRITHWLAGNEKFLQLIREGLQLYEAFARSVNWYNESAPLKSNQQAGTIYKTAKASVIGGGYGIGAKKFVATAFKLAGLKISLDESKEIIARFRAAAPEITGLWDRLTRDFEASVGGDYIVELPSGRKIIYRNVTRESKLFKDPETGQPRRKVVTTAEFFNEKTQRIVREALWGGAILENIVQALAREIFMYQTLEIENRLNLPVLLHVYDESVTSVPAASSKEALQEILEVHSKTPEYAPGLPLGAEGSLADRYKK